MTDDKTATLADGECRTMPIYFAMRALPGYVNRWIDCAAVKIEVSPTGEAQLIVRDGIVRDMDVPVTDDGVSDHA